VTSGQGVLVGNLFGVAATTATEGTGVEIATVGVYELPKLVSAVIAAGARVAWDDTAKQVVLPGTGMVPVGIATLAAGNGVATVRVRLDGVSTEAA
jgi:predicted RecA/RadA family phage recombinase